MKRLALAAVTAGATFGLVWWRTSEAPAPAGRGIEHAPLPVATIDVPLARGAIVLDGALHDEAWRDTDARTGPLLSAGEPARPHADARFVRDGASLWVGVYAADEDVRGGDLFRVTLGDRVITVTARCDVAGDARAKCDFDGSLDDAVEDEEWAAELATPLAGLGPRAPFVVERCEVGQPCARYSGILALGRP